MSSSSCCFLTCIQISQEAGQVVWYSHLLKNFPQFVVIHTIKGFGIVNKAEVRGVWISILCFHSLANNINFETEILRIKWEITWLPLGTVINNIWVCLLTRLNVQNFFFLFCLSCEFHLAQLLRMIGKFISSWSCPHFHFCWDWCLRLDRKQIWVTPSCKWEHPAYLGKIHIIVLIRFFA